MTQNYRYQFGNISKTVIIKAEGDAFSATVGEKCYRLAVHPSGEGEWVLTVDGRRVRAAVVQVGHRYYVALDGQTWLLTKPDPAQPSRRKTGSGPVSDQLTASMPGQVVTVAVAPGQHVTQGQTLAVLEAMKMELRLTAPFAGRVEQLHCAPGQVVEQDQLLIELVEDKPSEDLQGF